MSSAAWEGCPKRDSRSLYVQLPLLNQDWTSSWFQLSFEERRCSCPAKVSIWIPKRALCFVDGHRDAWVCKDNGCLLGCLCCFRWIGKHNEQKVIPIVKQKAYTSAWRAQVNSFRSTVKIFNTEQRSKGRAEPAYTDPSQQIPSKWWSLRLAGTIWYASFRSILTRCTWS